MTIKNRSLLTHVDFLPTEKFKLIGEYAEQKLLLVGRAKGYGDPIVAISPTSEPSQDELSAHDLYELMKFGDKPVNITSAIWS